MQPLIDKLQTLLGGNVGFKIGLILAAVLALQLVLMLAGTMRQLLFQSLQRRRESRLLKRRIETEELRYKDVEKAQVPWNGLRKFRVQKKVLEARDCNSFYLVPHDGRPLPPFKPGQFVTFQLNMPKESKPVVRCYSLSDGPGRSENYYRVTIKREIRKDGSHGLASSFFCDIIAEGDILDVKAPDGKFFLDLAQERPVVLIGGGVGVTPVLSMLNGIVASGSKREVWFFFGIRDSGEHIQKQQLETIAKENENVHLHICYSRPGQDDRLGVDYQHAERVSVDLFKKVLPSSNFEYYLCGPGPFMASITDGLEEWGVPKTSVFYEAFGPATVPPKKAGLPTSTEGAKQIEVTFSKSGKVLSWSPESECLLKFAETNGITTIDTGCWIGNCGSCKVAIKSGEVEDLPGRHATIEGGSCLACSCRPKSNLVLDA